MVDAEIVARHLSDLDECLRALDGERPVSAENLVEDRKRRDLVLYELQRAIQNLLDLGSHLLADRGGAVGEYGQILPRLAVEGVVPEGLAVRLEGLGGFRNVLIHGYVDLDLDIVAGVVNERLDDLRELAATFSDASEASDPEGGDGER